MADLQELYSRDPLSLTKEDRAEIVLALRKQRVNFNTAGTPAKSVARTKIKEIDPDLEGEKFEV